MAASNLTLGVEIIGEFKRLTSATNGAKKNLTSMQRSANAVSAGIFKAFSTIGLGLSFVALTRELKEATKAAVEDEKSQGLLANAMRNSANATQMQISAAEKSITQMSLQAAVADDKIRPAFGNLVRATGDVTKSTGLMKLALDIAAGTGKDVETVSKALSKAVGPDGTTGALEKLVPAIKGANDPLAELDKLFSGAALTAANLDPYQRMKIAFDEIQESVGTALLPVLESFASWLVDVTPSIQGFFSDLTDPTTETGEAWAGLTDAVVNFGDEWTGLEDKVNGSTFFTGIVDGLQNIITNLDAVGAYFSTQATGWGQILSGDFSGGISTLGKTNAKLENITGNKVRSGLQQLQDSQSNSGTVKSPKVNNVTINTYNSNLTANDIVQKLNKATRANGTIGATF